VTVVFGRFRKNRIISVRELWQRANRLQSKGKTEEAKELLMAAAQAESPIDRHYAYIRLIQLYRELAAQNPEEKEALAAICRQDIELFPEFYEVWVTHYGHTVSVPYFPSFTVLAGIYEEQGRTDKAIEICELAVGYGLTETREEDYPERLDRLLGKSGTPE
jgi:tetratricopeptide (TPR) repeat protein